MQKLTELEGYPDIDLEEFWNDFADVPTPPPCLASGQGFPNTLSYEKVPQRAERPPFIEFIFYPSFESECGYIWPGPDPLSYGTSADDMFLYMSTFLVLEQVHWLEFRLCKLNGANVVTEQFLFFVPRFETILGNINRVRGQIQDIISRHDDHIKGYEQRRFQLLIYPRQEYTSAFVTGDIVPALCSRPTLTVPVLDPGFFVQNIIQGFEN